MYRYTSKVSRTLLKSLKSLFAQPNCTLSKQKLSKFDLVQALASAFLESPSGHRRVLRSKAQSPAGEPEGSINQAQLHFF